MELCAKKHGCKMVTWTIIPSMHLHSTTEKWKVKACKSVAAPSEQMLFKKEKTLAYCCLLCESKDFTCSKHHSNEYPKGCNQILGIVDQS